MIEYSGEHPIPGIVGHIAVILSFSTAVFSTFLFYLSTKKPEWLKTAKGFFKLHMVSVIFIIATLFYMLLNNMFEYHYVWQHSSKELPLRYIFSCFWEGQEGSFILWMFWHSLLGFILMRNSKSWSPYVMTIFSAVQIFLASMILGIQFGDWNLGSNPFTVLLREHPDFANLPLFTHGDYLTHLDGRGLNPLLQNYWMTIHPPTLFLGFAASLPPFCFALAGLWKKDWYGWVKPCRPWAFFGVATLGAGVLMGGAWAYEALSFGGFWAWDPVENASLVPWLMLVGGAHLMLMTEKRNPSVFTMFFLTTAGFLLVLYSTFLTRSGILGDSSVHAFTDLGLSGQLLLYLLFFVFLTICLMLIDNITKWAFIITASLCMTWGFAGGWNGMNLGLLLVVVITALIRSVKLYYPKSKEDENLSSREFWMLIGALVLFISSFQIITYTSIPVFNKITPLFSSIWELLNGWFDSDKFTQLANGTLAPKTNMEIYNKWQLPVAIILSVILGFTQFLNYKSTAVKSIMKPLIWVVVSAAIFTTVISLVMSITNFLFIMLIFTSTFAVICNVDLWVRIFKRKTSKLGQSMAHIGFGLLILGALISTSQQKIISNNSSGMDISSLGEGFENHENILLMKNDTVPMGEHFVVYKNRSKEGVNVYYEMEYLNKTKDGFVKEFSLFPRVQTNPRMGNVSEPDTRHYLSKDIYTHITYARLEDLDEDKREVKDTIVFESIKGDTVFTRNCIVVFESLVHDLDSLNIPLKQGDLGVAARFRIVNMNRDVFYAHPVFLLRDNMYSATLPSDVSPCGLTFTFDYINTETNAISCRIFDRGPEEREFVIMKAIVFPAINILWLGCVLMVLGTFLAIYQRVKINGKP